MRPLKLTMSAFGSYGEKTEIDFSQLDGLYIITGDTGAGKTTIFDAIVFALYGDTSGGIREPSMMRSDFAGDDTPTFVELEFLYRGKTYKTERSPSYKKSGRSTPLPASAALTLPDGSVKTGAREVTNLITELLGVDREQFTQTAMIAQGEFLRLLLADTEERGKIFRKIFGTGIYISFQERLKDMLSEEKTRLGTIKSELVRCAEVIGADDTPDTPEGFESLSDTLGAKTAECKAENNALAEESEKLGARSAALLQELAQLKSMSASLDIKAGEVSSEIKNEIAEKLKSGGAGFVFGEEMAKIKADLAERARIIAARADLKKTAAGADELKNLIGTLLASKNELSLSLADTEKRLASMPDTALLRQKLDAELRICESDIADVSNAEKKLARFNALGTELAAAQKAYLVSEQKYRAAENAAIAAEEAFLREQAGIMAAALQDGLPCPVCGSAVHPSPASASENAPSEDDVKRLRAAAKKADAVKNEKAKKAAELLSGQKLYADELRAAAAEFSSDIHGLEGIISSKKPELEQKKQALLGELLRADETEKARAGLAAESEKLRRAFEAASQKYDSSKAALGTAELELEALKSRIAEMESRLNYGGDVRIKEKRLASAKACIAELEREYSAEAAECARAKTENEKLARAAYARLETLRAAEKKYKSLMPSFREQLKRFESVSALSKTASGELSGRAKLAFEQYVQRAYFERVLSRANARLLKLSGGRYKLVRRAEPLNIRAKTGLELDIFDHYTGRRRSVRSLSGGESFKASLALALGMSDMIQESAGGVRLDSMFIDEGFGALDDESLDLAVNTLSKLADSSRSVGIISHVPELKERIEKKLIVKKSRRGSCVFLDI